MKTLKNAAFTAFVGRPLSSWYTSHSAHHMRLMWPPGCSITPLCTLG